MKIRLLALGLAWAASLYGQYNQHHRFSWQEACFKNPALPYCAGNDFAVKHQGLTKDAAHPNAGTEPSTATPEIATPSVIVVGGLDWRFADPSADALLGFNFNGLSASPLARSFIAELGANQRLAEADIQKIFDGLTNANRVALSIRDNHIVVMIAGRVTDSTLPAPQAGWKAVPLSGNAMLVGHADAVDQAVQRIAAQGPQTELARLAAARQAHCEFWAVGSPGFLGPQAASTGVKRFSLAVWMGNSPASDMAFEFDGAPSANTLGLWQTTLGSATVEGNALHFRTSGDADEVQQRFAQIAASPLGQRLAVLLEASRYLPLRDAAVSKKPVIYGLDDGPKELH